MAVKKVDTQIRQEQIARATLELVAAGGLKKLSVAAVARQVGLVPSALYRHFKSKEEVLNATVELIEEMLRNNIEAAQEEASDPVEQLHRLLLRHVSMIEENRSIPQIIFAEEFYGGRPARRRRVYQLIQGYLAAVERIIQQGQESGQIDRKIDSGVAAVMFLGLVQPSAILSILSDGEFDVNAHATRAWPLFLRAIRAKKAEGTCSS
ncbi:MAG: TetR/AcrR family transcriptional regulator [Thermogutta sp.]